MQIRNETNTVVGGGHVLLLAGFSCGFSVTPSISLLSAATTSPSSAARALMMSYMTTTRLWFTESPRRSAATAAGASAMVVPCLDRDKCAAGPPP